MSTTRTPIKTTRRGLLVSLGLGLLWATLYLASAQIGHLLAVPPSDVTPLWPPAGVALAVLVIAGPRNWPSILIGAFAAQTLSFFNPNDLVTSVMVGSAASVGATLQAWLGAIVLTRWVDAPHPFTKVRHILVLAVVAYVVGTISPTVGVASLYLSGVMQPEHLLAVWDTWWLGDALGVLVVSPLPLMWSSRSRTLASRSKIVEAVVFHAVLALVAANLFADPFGLGLDHLPLGALLLPFLLWGTHRFKGLATGIFPVLIAGVAIAGTLAGHGPFASASTHQSIVLVQVYLGVLICAGFALAASDHSHSDARSDALSSEERLRALISAVPDLLMLYNKDGMPVERLSGLTSTDTNLSMVSRENKVVAHIIKQVLATGVPREVEYSVPSKSGGTWWWARAVRVYDGLEPHVLWVARDITQQKHLEYGLRQKQKMAAIGQLAGGVAHDFNNLLTVINGNVQMILRDEHATHQHELQEVQEAGIRAAALTRQLLDFSRSEVVQPTTIDLNKTIHELHSMMRRVLEETVTVTINLTEQPTHLLIDRNQLEQVVINLVINARDALVGTTNRSIIIRTRATADLVTLEVQDNGHGMDDDVLERIFEPFYTTKDLGKGTGLGLSTVYSIVRRWNGEITVHSAPGEGSNFRIVWPSHVPSFDAIPTPEPTQLGAAQVVLVVEDESLVRKLAVRVLKTLGYRVLHAGDGREALTIAAAPDTNIDVLLTDLILPDQDGTEVAERVRKLQPQVQVVYMSGYTNDIIGEQGVLDRDIIFVQKPFTVQQIAQAMTLALRRSNKADPTSSRSAKPVDETR